MSGRFSYLLVGAVILSAISAGYGAEKSISELELKTERVIVFKDGYSLVIKRGTAITDKSGEVFTDDVPDAAVLGTFWAVPDEGRLISMLAGWKLAKNSEEKQLPCAQPVEILLANKGRQAKLELQDKTLVYGVIHEVFVDKTEAPVTPAQLEMLDLAPLSATAKSKALLAAHSIIRLAAATPTSEHTLTSISGAHFVLRADEGDVLLPVSAIRTIVVKDMKTTIAKTFSTARKTKRLSFKFEAAEKKQTLSIMYFRPGMRWIPTYRISLSDKPEKKTATARLQAELLNEADDLAEVPVDIVVGVPNFRFRGTPSPLTLEVALRNALVEAAPVLMGNGNQLSNAMFTQRAGEFHNNQPRVKAAEQNAVDLPGELTAGGAQDLFVYNLPQITLGKSDRIAVPIFSADVPYRDVYTWDLHVTKHDIDAAPSGAGLKSPLALSKNEVWHQIVLNNTTGLPWTTGAAMFMQGNQPLGQELLTYTPPKDEVRVPVTVSVDTRGSVAEKEVSRDLKALQWNGHSYARIDKELTLDLRNNKAIDIAAEITLRIGGKVDKASNYGLVTLSAFNAADWVQYHGDPAVNNSSTVTWKINLKPGENFAPTATYHHYTRQ
jgi:hypothetical protein